MKRSIFSFLILLAVWPIAACGDTPVTAEALTPKTDKLSAVQVVAARQQTISRDIEVTGDIVATNTVTIRSNVEGPVGWCPWREGDVVQKGERLVKIDRPVYRQEVRGAEAALVVARARLAALKAGARDEEVAQAAETVKELESCAAFAKTDLERVGQLVQSGAMPEESLEKARLAHTKCETSLAAARDKHALLKNGPTTTDVAVQAALVKEAEAKLDLARARLAECVVTAPFSGVVTRAYVNPGDLAQARAPLLEMMEAASIVVRFSVPASQSRVLKIQDRVMVALDALPGSLHPASIVRVYPQIDPRTRTRLAEARVEDDLDLAPGMFARVTLTTQSSTNGVVVPDRALVTRSDGSAAVFVVVGNAAVQRMVKTGIESGTCVQLIEGVRPGEAVILAGHEKLKSGAPVKARRMDGEQLCPRQPAGGKPS